MPQERDNPYPMPKDDEIKAWQAEADPATFAARQVMIRNIDGLFRRPYLRGDCDHAPILKGVRDLTAVCIAMLDHLDPDPDAPSNMGAELHGLVANMRALVHYKLED